jgi:hypothetical protein
MYRRTRGKREKNPRAARGDRLLTSNGWQCDEPKRLRDRAIRVCIGHLDTRHNGE